MGSHTWSPARRLGSDNGFRSINKLLARFLRCSIVTPRSCDSSCRVGSRSPSIAVFAFAQSSRMRSSILRCGRGMNKQQHKLILQNSSMRYPTNGTHSYSILLRETSANAPNARRTKANPLPQERQPTYSKCALNRLDSWRSLFPPRKLRPLLCRPAAIPVHHQCP